MIQRCVKVKNTNLKHGTTDWGRSVLIDLACLIGNFILAWERPVKIKEGDVVSFRETITVASVGQFASISGD